MAEGDELLTRQVLESKIAVARKELHNLRRDVNSLKRMFIHKFNEVKEMVEKGAVRYKSLSYNLSLNNILHLAQKYAQKFFHGHYLFREANSF